MRFTHRFTAAALVLTCAFVAAPASAAFVDPLATPAGATPFTNWTRSDTDSTYQQWRGTTNGGTPSLAGEGENFTTTFGLNLPDGDYVNPNGIPTAQFLDATRNSSGVTSAILIGGTQNIYSFLASADWEVLSPDFGYGPTHTTTAILQIELLGNEILVGPTTPDQPTALNTVKVDGQGWVDHVELSRVGAGGGGDAVTHWFRFELPTNAVSHVVEFDTYESSLGVFSDGLYGHVSVAAIAFDTLAQAAVLAGDLNADGFVGVDDLNIVLVNWNQSVTPGDLLSGDATGEGFVGVDDLNIVLVNWNAGAPPHGEPSVPEPGALTLLGVCGITLLCRKY